VIIDAIKESRRIFQRMNSYAIYRIAETLRVLLFMTLSILIFNFYPLTAVMIVMLALLNDGAILSIAYDNVHYKDQPEAWNMRVVLGVSTVLGIFGVMSAFGLFYLGERVFHLDRAHIQTLMYLKLSVAGHLTIFLTRTRGPFWSIRPARVLWIAVLGTQTIATLIAVYGVFMTPLGWSWAALVWGYALVWFLVNDRVKLLTYWVLDRSKVTAMSQSGAVSQPEAKIADSSRAKAEPAAIFKSPPQEGENPMPKSDTAPKPDTAAKPDTKAAAKPEIATPPEPEAKAEPESKPNVEPESPVKAEASANVDQQPEAKAAPQPESQAGFDPQASAGVTKLINTTLGDILLAGVLKDPESAGRIIAEAISHAEAPSPSAATTATESNAKPQPGAKTKEPSASTPATAK
jgi:H+-transporting ATPase